MSRGRKLRRRASISHSRNLLIERSSTTKPRGHGLSGTKYAHQAQNSVMIDIQGAKILLRAKLNLIRPELNSDYPEQAPR